MDIVRIGKPALLEIVKKNREKHAADYKEAIEGYFVSAIATMEKALASVADGNLEPITINEQPPVSHLAEYDRIIRKLDVTLDTVIDLNDIAFRNYVDDEWNWRVHWNNQNSKYMGLLGAENVAGTPQRAAVAVAKFRARDK